MENLNEIFGLTSDSVLKDDAPKNASEFYRPDAKDGKDNVYKALIRFLPNLNNPAQTIVSKWCVWLEDPITEQKMNVDCPSTIGQKSIIQDVFWALKKSDSASDQKLSETFSRREVFFSLIKILKDTNKPEFDGQVKIFKYGRKVYNKIRAIMKPEDEEITANNPFDLVDGRPFMLHIKLVSGYNNYDDSQFLDKKSPLQIDGETITNDPKWVPKIREYFSTLPDPGKFAFAPWTPEIEEHVHNTILHVVPSGKISEQILKKHNVSNGVSIPKGSSKIEEIGSVDENADTKVSKSKPTNKKETAATTPKVKVTDPDDEFDLDDIDTDDIDDDLYDGI